MYVLSSRTGENQYVRLATPRSDLRLTLVAKHQRNCEQPIFAAFLSTDPGIEFLEAVNE